MLEPGRRTVATTKSPGRKKLTFGPTASTCPKPSWPTTRKSYPSGAAPYSAALISRSVPSTPTRRTRTSTPRPSGTSDGDGFASSARWTLFGRPGSTAIAFIVSSSLLQQFGDERGPAGLMAGADTGAGVAVEVFMERDQVVPVRVALEVVVRAEHGPAPLGIAYEDRRESARELLRHVPQGHQAARAGRAFHLVSVSEIVMKLLQGLDQQEVDREPDRPPPVRVAAEESSGRFGRLVVDAVLDAADIEHIRTIAVDA